MALANIRKEEVDLLLAQIKDIMDQKEHDSAHDFISANHSDEKVAFVRDQIADPHSDNFNCNLQHVQASPDEYDSSKLKDDINSSSSLLHSKRESHSITVDALMRDLLTPLLKDWLDINLSSLVKDIVDRKIEKLINEYQITIDKDEL